MKLEPHDDGYETGADMLLNTASITHNHEVKCEKLEDPYSFIDDDPIPLLPSAPGPPHLMHPMPPINNQLLPGPKKRGRKKKIKPEQPEFNQDMNGGIPRPIKERKKHDRFNGMPEEEVSKRTLPDHLTENLDIIIIGINPGLFAAYKGHHYAGPGNHFWKCLYLSGLTPQQMSADEDYKLLQVGIGFTNMVQRATKGSADLTRKEIKEGSQILLDKLRKFRPKIAVFNGKLIYEVFSGKKDFNFGRQPDVIEGTNTVSYTSFFCIPN
nr:G/T mismatch-specific thymine DNA glycosylase-like isoform X2 [Leptinotarsa decemlineata]XP_023025456.1 G/T mismatch-specific thymine DNA glycosylase-like isoform X2 [Leptinotarsa decemlineata]